MDYIGSKAKLNDWIFSKIESAVPALPENVFIDGCSGSAVVSRYAIQRGYSVIANDIMHFPRALANGSINLSTDQINRAQHWVELLNTLSGIKGYFYNNFSWASESRRKYFSVENAKLLDHIRIFIELESDTKVRDCLLYCAIEALSRSNNTAGTHGAFLKQLKSRAQERLQLRFEPVTCGFGSIEAYSQDILKLVKTHTGNVLYIDPPYNSRQYGNNYHLYETFVRYDNSNVIGKTGLRENWQAESGSKFCSKKYCLDFTKEIIGTTSAQYVFLSYSSDGLLTKEEILGAFSNALVHEQAQKRYRADKSDVRTYDSSPLVEYLFQIKKGLVS